MRGGRLQTLTREGPTATPGAGEKTKHGDPDLLGRVPVELTGLQRSFKNLALARMAENAGPGVRGKMPSTLCPQGMRESSPPGKFC